MSSSWRADLGGRLLALLPAAAAAVAEGAWIAVWYAAFAAPDRPVRSLGLAAFVVAAAIGVLLGRRLRVGGGRAVGRQARNGQLLAVTLAVAGGAAVGLLAEAPPPGGDLRAWLGSLGAALGRGEAGGLLLGVAVWRGTRHGDPERDDLVTAGLLGWGAPSLALPWLVGGLRPSAGFVEEALLGTLVFVGASFVAIGLTRLEALDRSVGLDWRRNRAWLVLLVAVVATATVVALPAAVLLGASVDALLGTLAGPLSAGLGAAEGAAEVLGRTLGASFEGLPSPGSAGQGGRATGGGFMPNLTIPGALAALAAVIFGLVMLVAALRLWGRLRGGRPSPPSPPVAEERHLRLPRPRVRLALPDLAIVLPRLGTRRARTATEAYLGLAARLAQEGEFARRPDESPSGHARRLRKRHLGSLRLDLLAADVALERFAGRDLPRRELARAIDRARDPRLGRRRRSGGSGG